MNLREINPPINDETSNNNFVWHKEDWYETEEGQLAYLKGCIEICNEFFPIGDSIRLNHFFGHALLLYYSPGFDGINTSIGHIVYRLSDALTPEERFETKIYPSETGSIMVNGHKWDNLDDFRKEWESNFEDIPLLTDQFPQSLKAIAPRSAATT